MRDDLLFENRGPAITNEDIALFERRWELRIPPSLREFFLGYNGKRPSQSNEFYPVPETFHAFYEEYNVAQEVVCGIYIAVFYPLVIAPPASSVERVMTGYADSDQLVKDRIPFAGDGCGNEFQVECGIGRKDTVFFWDHELQREFQVAESVDEFLERLTHAPQELDTET